MEVGIRPFLIYAFAIAIFFLGSQMLIAKFENGGTIYALLALFLINSKTGNAETVALFFSRKSILKVLLTEALILSAPFIIFLLIQQFYLEATALCLLSVLSIFIGKGIQSMTIPTPFHSRPFEFIVGFRQAYLAIGTLYILSFIAAFVSNYNLGMFSMIILFLIIVNFYSKPEDPLFVWIHKNSPKEFLIKKIKTALLFSSLLLLPATFALTIGFPEKMHITIGIQLVAYLLPIVALLNKYYSFPRSSDIVNSILLGLCALFPPLFLLVIPYLFSKSSQNLKEYL